jgi:hypothetical protein
MNSALRARRYAIIGSCFLSAALVLAGFITDPATEANGREMWQAYAADPGQQALHSILLHYGFALWSVVAFGIVGLVRGRGAWIANAAAVLAVLGLTTLAGIVMIDFYETAVTNTAGIDATERASQELEGSIAFISTMVLMLLGALLAIPVAVAAAWRAGLVSWWAFAAALVAFLAIQVSPHALTGSVVFALGLGTVGVALLRIPVDAWSPATGRADATPVQHLEHAR